METLRPPTRRVRIAAILVGTTGFPAVLVILAAVFDRAFIVGVPANATTGLGAEPLAVLFVAASAGGGGFFQEEVEELVADG
jgi:hypothetical protein